MGLRMSEAEAKIRSSVDPGEEISVCIIRAIAEFIETHYSSLPVLNETLDVEALNDLAQSADETLSLSFEYAGCTVSISETDTVTVAKCDT